VVYLAELRLCNSSFSKLSEFMLSVPRVEGPLADSGINDRLVKLRPLIDQTCSEFISVSYFVVCYFSVKYLIPRNYYTTLPVESITQM